MRKYHSFDVFDTCLVRTCGRPDIVFDILAHQVLGSDASIEQRVDFAYERKQAESRARKTFCNPECEDITLEQIYSVSNFAPYTERTTTEIMSFELEIERSVLVPVKFIKHQIDLLRKKDCNIVYVSDMYLSSTFLISVLRQHGLFKDGDRIFVSSEVKMTKQSGRLYHHVHSALGISFSNWCHTGDNVLSDVTVPRSLGIQAKHAESVYTYYERCTASKDFTSIGFEAFKLASISRAVLCDSDFSAHELFAADFIAPVYVPYVYNVLQHASAHGISSLYFLARDGYIFYQIANVLHSKFPQIELHYLYVSRNSLYLPGLEDTDIASVRNAFLDLENQPVKQILDRLQLGDLKLDTSDRVGEEALRWLYENETFVSALNTRHEEQRDLALRYFQQEGLDRPGSAVVDLGGTRRCHTAINSILQGGKVYGYYLFVDKNREIGNNYHALLFKERIINNTINCSIDPHYILENYFSISPHRRTVSYSNAPDGRIVPIFETDGVGSERNEAIFAVHKRICEQYAFHYMNICDLSYPDRHCCIAVSTYSHFMLSPEKRYVLALVDFLISDSKFQHSALLFKSHFALASLGRRIWYKGNLVYNCRFPGLMTYLMRHELLDSAPWVSDVYNDTKFALRYWVKKIGRFNYKLFLKGILTFR